MSNSNLRDCQAERVEAGWTNVHSSSFDKLRMAQTSIRVIRIKFV